LDLMFFSTGCTRRTILTIGESKYNDWLMFIVKWEQLMLFPSQQMVWFGLVYDF
jgi:hypothetical protein